MKSLEHSIEALVAPTVTGMGFELVQVKLMDSGKSKLLQIMAERPDGSMSVDDCAAISHQISAVLDVEDLLPGNYRLEISSPGIDRPLVKPADYVAYIGHAAKIELFMPVAGRKRYTGELQALAGDMLSIAVDGKPVVIALADIQSAKLVLTDKLIKEHQKKAG